MSVYVYVGDRYYQLPGNKIVQSGVYITFKNTDSLVLDGQRYTLGVVPNQVITQRTVYVQSGQAIADAQLSVNGVMYVSSGGTATNIDITSGGTMYVSSGGYADTLTLNVGGSLICNASAGFRFPVKLNGGYLYASTGYIYHTVPNTFSNAVLQSGDRCTLASGTTAVNLTIGPGAVAYTHCTTYNNSDNIGGTIVGAIISSGGRISVDQLGCSVTDIHIKSKGVLYISSRAVSSASGETRARAYVSNVQVSSGGTLVLPAGIYARGILLYKGATVSKVAWVSSGNTLTQAYGYTAYNPFGQGNVNISGTGQALMSGSEGPSSCIYYGAVSGHAGLISKTELLSGQTFSKGKAYVFGGRVTDCTVNGTGATVYVDASGACVDSTTVQQGGTIYVSSGGIASQIIVNSGGNVNISSGGTARDITINSGGTLTVYSGGIALDITNSDGSYITA